MDKLLMPINTPLLKIFDKKRNNIIYLKDETKQYTNAFKYRGVYNKFKTTNFENYNGVITSSTGNHGQAVSFAANQIGIDCTIVLPYNTPILKKEKIEKNNAIIISDKKLYNYDICTNYAKKIAKERNLLYIPSFDDIDIVNGHKKMFDEIAFDIDYCFCPIGGGGLVSAALESESLKKTIVIGVELKKQDSMNQSLKKNDIICVDIVSDENSFCEGILVKKVGDLNFKISKKHNLKVNLVNTNEIKDAIRKLNKLNIRAEGAGASAYAAYLKSNIKNSFSCFIETCNEYINMLG